MTMLKALVIVALVAVGGLLVYTATRPDVFRVERSAAVKAPPERIFALINDFHRWPSWSPYETKDPAMKRILSGSSAGTGAVYAWDGNGNVGRGRMEIVESVAPSKAVIKLDFFAPMEASNVAEFRVVPNGDVTNVTWSLEGPSPFLSKLVGVFIDIDRMVGNDFEAGLANLKAIAER